MNDFFNAIKSRIQKLTTPVMHDPMPKAIPTPTPDQGVPGMDSDYEQSLARALTAKLQPTAAPTVASRVPMATPMTQAPSPTDVERKLRSGLNEYGQGAPLPITEHMPVIMDAVNNIQFWKDNPYLANAINILETSGGRNVTRENNMLNYGVRDPKIAQLFKQVGTDDALRRSLKEIGETGNTYKRFRTGKTLTDEELQDFAQTYEPTNGDYYKMLKQMIETFDRQ